MTVDDPTVSGGDRIELRGLRIAAVCGVLPEERDRPQPLEIDVDVYADLRTPGRSDNLDDTVDYGAICDRIAQVCVSGAPRLLEYLADRIADAILEDPAVDAVELSVRKLRPPVAQQLATSGVRVLRGRAESVGS